MSASDLAGVANDWYVQLNNDVMASLAAGKFSSDAEAIASANAMVDAFIVAAMKAGKDDFKAQYMKSAEVSEDAAVVTVSNSLYVAINTYIMKNVQAGAVEGNDAACSAFASKVCDALKAAATEAGEADFSTIFQQKLPSAGVMAFTFNLDNGKIRKYVPGTYEVVKLAGVSESLVPFRSTGSTLQKGAVVDLVEFAVAMGTLFGRLAQGQPFGGSWAVVAYHDGQRYMKRQDSDPQDSDPEVHGLTAFFACCMKR